MFCIACYTDDASLLISDVTTVYSLLRFSCVILYSSWLFTIRIVFDILCIFSSFFYKENFYLWWLWLPHHIIKKNWKTLSFLSLNNDILFQKCLDFYHYFVPIVVVFQLRKILFLKINDIYNGKIYWLDWGPRERSWLGCFPHVFRQINYKSQAI